MIVIRCYFWPMKGMSKPGDISLIHFSPNFVATFPVQVFAYTCAQNVSCFSRSGVAMLTVDAFCRFSLCIMRLLATARGG